MIRPLVAFAVALGAGMVIVQEKSDVGPREALHDFMERKLDHLEGAIGGLSRNDLAAVAEHADKLGLICLDLNWNVIQSDEYFERSAAFRRTTATLAQSAREQRLERAQLACLDLVGQCFSCHDYVRGDRAEAKAGAAGAGLRDLGVARGAPVATPLRVGIFTREKLLVAYYHSAEHDRVLRDLMAKRDAAKQRGDSAEVARLEEQGSAMQELAHQQLAGTAELGKVLDAVRPILPQVAKERGLALIVERPLWNAPDIELVDVSDALAASIPSAR